MTGSSQSHISLQIGHLANPDQMLTFPCIKNKAANLAAPVENGKPARIEQILFKVLDLNHK